MGSFSHTSLQNLTSSTRLDGACSVQVWALAGCAAALKEDPKATPSLFWPCAYSCCLVGRWIFAPVQSLKCSGAGNHQVCLSALLYSSVPRPRLASQFLLMANFPTAWWSHYHASPGDKRRLVLFVSKFARISSELFKFCHYVCRTLRKKMNLTHFGLGL